MSLRHLCMILATIVYLSGCQWIDGGICHLGSNNETLVIGALPAARSIKPDWAFITGSEYTTARCLLLNPEYFSPQGMVPKAILFQEVNEINACTLSDIDIFVFSPSGWWKGVTRKELSCLERFVKRGGSMLEMRDTHNRPLFMHVTPGEFFSEPYATIADHGLNPLTDGIFGTVHGNIRMGASGTYGDSGIVTPIVNLKAGPNLVMLGAETGYKGTGRAVLVGDEELFQNLRINELDNNRKLFLNIFAYLAIVKK